MAVFCENCGLKQNEYAKFCPGCGSKIMQINQNVNAGSVYPPPSSAKMSSAGNVYPPPAQARQPVYPPVTKPRAPMPSAYPPGGAYRSAPVPETTVESEEAEMRRKYFNKLNALRSIKSRCTVAGVLWMVAFAIEIVVALSLLFSNHYFITKLFTFILPVGAMVRGINTFKNSSSLRVENANSEEYSYLSHKSSSLSTVIFELIFSVVMIFIFNLASIYLVISLFSIMHVFATLELAAAIVDKTISVMVVENREIFLKKMDKRESGVNLTPINRNADWICKKCGFRNEASSIFCKDCGAYK